MKSIIQFLISRSEKHYVAEAVGFPIVTQGKTFEELTDNIKEAVEVYLHDEDAAELGVISHPSLLMNFEIRVHA